MASPGMSQLSLPPPLTVCLRIGTVRGLVRATQELNHSSCPLGGWRGLGGSCDSAFGLESIPLPLQLVSLLLSTWPLRQHWALLSFMGSNCPSVSLLMCPYSKMALHSFSSRVWELWWPPQVPKAGNLRAGEGGRGGISGSPCSCMYNPCTSVIDPS